MPKFCAKYINISYILNVTVTFCISFELTILYVYRDITQFFSAKSEPTVATDALIYRCIEQYTKRKADHMNDITEEMLVAQMKLGDRQAFAELYDRYKPSVYRTACLISGNAQDGEDIMQETFIKAFVHCKELKSNKMFRYWLLRILNRTAWRFIISTLP